MKAKARIITTMTTATGDIIKIKLKKDDHNLEVRVYFRYYGLSIAKTHAALI